MTKSSDRKALKDILGTIELQGWNTEITNGGHWKLAGPDGQLVFTSTTPGDHRSLKNLRGQLKRAGADLAERRVKPKNWPPVPSGPAQGAPPIVVPSAQAPGPEMKNQNPPETTNDEPSEEEQQERKKIMSRKRRQPVEPKVLHDLTDHPNQIVHADEMAARTGLTKTQVQLAVQRLIRRKGVTIEIVVSGNAWRYDPDRDRVRNEWGDAAETDQPTKPTNPAKSQPEKSRALRCFEELLSIEASEDRSLVILRDEEGQVYQAKLSKLGGI